MNKESEDEIQNVDQDLEEVNLEYPESVNEAAHQFFFDNEIRKPLDLILKSGSWRIERNHESRINDAEKWLKQHVHQNEYPWNVFRLVVFEAYSFGSKLLRKEEIDKKILLDGLEINQDSDEQENHEIEISKSMLPIIKLKNLLIAIGMTSNDDFKILCKYLKIRDRKTGEMIHKEYEKFRKTEVQYNGGYDDKNTEHVNPTQEELDQFKLILRI